jgi:hypothetical protein
MTRARADLAVDFKRCCMLSGEFDGSDRDYFFQVGDSAHRLAPDRIWPARFPTETNERSR